MPGPRNTGARYTARDGLEDPKNHPGAKGSERTELVLGLEPNMSLVFTLFGGVKADLFVLSFAGGVYGDLNVMKGALVLEAYAAWTANAATRKVGGATGYRAGLRSEIMTGAFGAWGEYCVLWFCSGKKKARFADFQGSANYSNMTFWLTSKEWGWSF